MTTPAAGLSPVGDAGTASDQDSRSGARGGSLGAQIARRIEDEIVSVGWPVGRNLGSEQDLQERYGVSRAVLREALRLVEHHQVARMRRGPGGGLFVTAPDAAPATRAMVIYLDYVGTSVDDLMGARLLLEPPAAELAAERLTEDGVRRLRDLLEEEARRREEPGIWSQDALHLALGELSGNPVLRAFIDILTRLTTRYAHTATHIPKTEAVRSKESAGRHHTAIVEAVISGGTGRAGALIAEHLTATADWLRTHRNGDPDDRIAPQLIEAPDGKLGEMVASRIHHEIAAGGWPIGEALGSEAELLARHGVSRAVLREAVRLLEYHGVARMRRGPGGGLLVTAPDPSASIETMALYLDYQRAGVTNLLSVREAIELGSLGPVIGRRDEPGVSARLRNAVKVIWPDDGRGAPQDPFHRELALLAGNPVLVLFLRVLTELWTRHASTQTPPLPGAETAVEVERVHQGILEAILAGDESLARYRMRRHLAILNEWWH
ncbi:FCD domain-containing protein [Actinomadura sp. NPDC048394]|jgi:DNA-binding FadR family transcriptional regulator|uniref:FadR/GntR family transcriptional regulator n=1 Tax=Actinomadura sp. NPDC048394 TaxID=3158223 RepID=UPI00340D68B2